MTGTNCDLFTHKSSWSYLNHLVYVCACRFCIILHAVSTHTHTHTPYYKYVGEPDCNDIGLYDTSSITSMFRGANYFRTFNHNIIHKIFSPFHDVITEFDLT